LKNDHSTSNVPGAWSYCTKTFISEVGQGTCIGANERQNSCVKNDGGVTILSSGVSTVGPETCGQVTILGLSETSLLTYSTVCRGLFDIDEGVFAYGMNVNYAIHQQDGELDLCIRNLNNAVMEFWSMQRCHIRQFFTHNSYKLKCRQLFNPNMQANLPRTDFH
jgi:hypothetical protein